MIRSRFVHKVPLILMLFDLVLVASLLIAPFTIEEGSVTGLDGRANAFDYTEKWDRMNPLAHIVYLFGDYNCHQKEERSLILNGNQLPVCARDMAIFTGLLLGAALLVRALVDDNPSVTVVGQLPSKWRRGAVADKPTLTFIGILFMLLLPTAVDGGVQLLSTLGVHPLGIVYESTNPTRILTGFPAGVALGLLTATLLMSLFSRRDAGNPALINYLFRGTRSAMGETRSSKGGMKDG